MKARHVGGYKQDARALLRGINAAVGQDFYTLSHGQIELLVKEADRVKYRLPKNANGSRARYFYELTQRRAK